MLFSMKKQFFEVKKLYNGSEKKFPCQLLILENGFGVIKYVMEKDYHLEHIFLPQGTVSLGFFWENRNYNIYQWFNDKGLIASYFNISDLPTLSEEAFIWQDFVLDILVDNRGNTKLLDEIELGIIKNEKILQTIQITKDELLQNYGNILIEIDTIMQQLSI